MNGDGRLPPQAIRRSDGSFHILNVDVEALTQVQRLAVAALVWDQVRLLLEANGEYLRKEGFWKGESVGTTEEIDRYVAKALNINWSSLNTVRPRLRGNEDVITRALAGEYDTHADLSRALGMKLRAKLSEGRPSETKPGSIFYGKGDRFADVIEPISRYLNAWEKKDFQFTHVPPGEAKRRLHTLDKVIHDLTKVRAEMEKRSRVATLSVPRGRRKKIS